MRACCPTTLVNPTSSVLTNPKNNSAVYEALTENLLNRDPKLQVKLSETDLWKGYTKPDLRMAIATVTGPQSWGVHISKLNGQLIESQSYKVLVPQQVPPEALTGTTAILATLAKQKPVVIGVPVTASLEHPKEGWIDFYSPAS